MNLWELPTSVRFAGEEYPHKWDFRQILRIIDTLSREDRPLLYRWYMALAMFYERPVSRSEEREAMAYLSDFLTCGEPGKPGPKLLDWDLDAPEIIADVNAVAGREIRTPEPLHWWTFLSYFRGIGEGQLSALVTIRDKLRRGKKLEPWEQEYYRQNRDKVHLRPPESQADAAEKARLQALLDN